MAKDKSEKKEKKRKEVVESTEVTETLVAGTDVEMEDVSIEKVWFHLLSYI